jgi:tight adherence protein C
MALIAILGVLLLAVAIGFGFVAVAEPRIRRAEKLGLIDVYGYSTPAQSEFDVRPARRTLDGLAATIGDFFAARVSSLRVDEVQRRLVAAGFFKVGARRFIGYRVLITFAVPILLIWLMILAGASTGATVAMAFVGGGLGWVVPGAVLGQRARSRLSQIDYEMPELIDLLVVILEAGVGFTAAMRMASERLGGALGEELRLTIQEQSLGLAPLESLVNFMERCPTPIVQSFVRSMVQGERLGVSMGQILRNLAVEMRKRRRQAAEERAHKAAIKILFPLVLLIFPAMFVIMLGPALYRIMDTLAGH